MSGIEQIKDRILSDAQDYAKEHIRVAEEKAEKILEAACSEAEERRTAIMEEAEREAADAGKRMIALADMELKKERLKAKRGILEEAFKIALEKLCSMPSGQYCGLLVHMIVSAAEGERAEIVLSDRDRKRLGGILEDGISLAAQGMGKQVDIGLSEQTRDICGGFILKTGDIEMNYSFEALMRARREELEEMVCSTLNIR